MFSVLFCFCKQRTAYEMRISDWSSDVCSSDLRIMLEDLRDPDVRERLCAIWTDPKSLDPTARAARVTRDIADLLATVARRLEKRGYNAETTSGFLMRVLFTMFAEDSGLIPHGSRSEEHTSEIQSLMRISY